MFYDSAFTDRLAHLETVSRIWWLLAVLSLLLLVWLSLGRQFRSPAHSITLRDRVHKLSTDNSALASMEFLMVLMPFLIIVMTVWQLAFMFNARLHVGYSAYAAARSAAVMIPADLPNEKEGELKQQGQSNSVKWSRIRAASVPGTLAISPGDFGSAVGVAAFNQTVLTSLPTGSEALGRLGLMSAHHPPGVLQGTRPLRALSKMTYAKGMTEVLINGQNHEKTQNLGDADQVTVTVNYPFWLNVPFVGGMLEATFKGRFMNPATGRPIFMSPYPSITLTETITMTAWPRKRAIEPCNP